MYHRINVYGNSNNFALLFTQHPIDLKLNNSLEFKATGQYNWMDNIKYKLLFTIRADRTRQLQ